MQKNRVLILLDKSSRLPKVPEIISDIFYLLENPSDTDKEQLNYLIKQCGEFPNVLIEYINTNYNKLNRKISNLDEAISYLGYKTIRNILIAALTRSLLPERLGKAKVFSREKYWKHCLGTAIISDLLAKKTGLYTKRELFAHGLTHDLGILVLDICLPLVLDKIYKNAYAKNIPLIQSEYDILEGITHADIGAWLCKKWGLPENIANVIEYHHRPLNAGKDQEEVKLVSVADAISGIYYEEELGITNGNFLERLKNDQIFKPLGIDDQDIFESLGLDDQELIKIKQELPGMIERAYHNINLKDFDVARFGIEL